MIEQKCNSCNADDTRLSKSTDEVNFCPFPMPPEYDLMPSLPINCACRETGVWFPSLKTRPIRKIART